jgi:predicted RNA-binding Zn-ribbon protein involved in translation (DUF1610 family)
MTTVLEKQFWCDDCKRTHIIKVTSTAELSDDDKATLFSDGEYADQLRKHSVCVSCGSNITPHTDLTLVSLRGEWKEICPQCARKQQAEHL